METVLEVSGLTFSYHPSSPILKNLTFTLKAGCLAAVIGVNASGKTTLLKILCGILTPQGGEHKLFGQSISTYSRENLAKMISYVPQEFSLSFPFTVEEVVLLGRSHLSRRYFYERQEDIHIAREALEQVGLQAKSSLPATSLSGGEKTLLSIARALAQRPRLFLLDEPSGFLDMKHKFQLISLLKTLAHDRGLCILTVTHDLFLFPHFDQIFALQEGMLAMSGAPDNFLRSDVLQKIYGIPVRIEKGPEHLYFSFNG